MAARKPAVGGNAALRLRHPTSNYAVTHTDPDTPTCAATTRTRTTLSSGTSPVATSRPHTAGRVARVEIRAVERSTLLANHTPGGIMGRIFTGLHRITKARCMAKRM